MSTNLKYHYTLEEYLALDAASDARYEYWDGEIFNMSGASSAHDLLQGNSYFALRSRLHGRNCRVFLSDMRLRVPSLPPYRYPDLAALCGTPHFEKIGETELLTNPTLIVEILSPSTEAFDRGEKFTHYKSIPSFSEYLLIAQHRPHVVYYLKQADGTWVQREITGLAESLYLVTLDCELPLSEIYQDVIFPPANPFRLLGFSEI